MPDGMDRDEEAMTLAEVQALLQVPGALKIVTARVVEGLRSEHSQFEVSAEALEADPDLLKRAETFELQDVVRIEGPDDDGVCRAFSQEGSRVEAYPTGLMRALRKWRRQVGPPPAGSARM